jgi:hypothetical protein
MKDLATKIARWISNSEDCRDVPLILEYVHSHGADTFKMCILSRALVAHSCNPSYSGGRDQEDRGSKSAGENSARDSIKKTHHKKGLLEWFRV